MKSRLIQSPILRNFWFIGGHVRTSRENHVIIIVDLWRIIEHRHVTNSKFKLSNADFVTPKSSIRAYGEYVFRSQKWWTFFRSQIFFSQSKFFFAVKTFFRSQSLFSQSEFIFAVKFDSDKGKIWLRKNDEELPIKIRSQKLSFFRSHPVHHSKIINVITNQDNTK